MRPRCAFGDNPPPTEGDFPIIVEYIGVNSSILLVTSMSVDRFVSVVCPHLYLLKVIIIIKLLLKSDQNTSSSAT